MSETSSDAESSCGWTIISNEGSDIETLGSETAVEYGAELLERPLVQEPEAQDVQTSVSAAVCAEERTADSLDNTLGEQTLDETLNASEVGDEAAGKEPVLSSSDLSDIVTLPDLKEGEHAEVEEEAAVHEDLYLGTSCSSQYAFSAAETGLLLSHWKLPQTLMNLSSRLRSQLTGGRSFPVFPVQPPAVTNSSSSEDEAGRSASTVVRRRRLRRSTTNTVTDPEDEAVLESRPSDDDDKGEQEVKEQKQQQEEEETEVRRAARDVEERAQNSSIFKTSILITVVIAAFLCLGHFYEKYEIKKKLFDDDYVMDLTSQEELFEYGMEEMHDDQIPLLMELESIRNENQELILKQAHVQTQRDKLEMLLKEKEEENTNMVSQQQKLAAENQLLKSSLQREEMSLSALQEELKSLHSKIRDLESMEEGADLLLSENQNLKEQLEEEKQVTRSFHGQLTNMMVETQTLRKKFDKERKVTDELRRELSQLRSRFPGAGKELGSEAEELQSRLMELEKRLSFEQQRSDLWERLYVETKEERAKGDTEPKVKKPKHGMAGKVKETFDAVKNSTKEFVHHHKEQIKKAKEAVKENLRKFSDSVKSTFRHFKDSASTFINKARGFYKQRSNEKNSRESWQHRSHKPHQRHKHDSGHNTRKSGDKVHQDWEQNTHKAHMKGCSGVFDCAYQESTRLFNKATEPIRADEFHKLLQSYLQQEVDHFHHWKELETFINNFFCNGVFIHDQMLFTDFVSGVENFLADMRKYHGLDDDTFGDVDDYIYRHFFGETNTKSYSPSGPFEGPEADSKEESRTKQEQRKQQRARSRPHSERKWSRSGRNADRHMADVKIELGPMPFDPKY
ncbi:cell cycle progression protein 1 isoform X1 [Haplochromis burtoni]|uniref:Cell cycle progression 1 n=1 Tax=Haplochromis burtoni TaxID=8153 RepID=A0A3Q2VNS2_HAPBU|nr:cell cycle progression protein 1 isoform X1 [Haplochromis burtoni]